MLNRLFEYVILSSGNFVLTVGQLLGLVVIILIASLAWRLTKAKWRVNFFNNYEIDIPNRRRFERHLRQIILLIAALFSIKLLNLDFELFNTHGANNEDGIVFKYSIFIVVLLLLVGAWIIEWFFSNILINKYEKDRKEDSFVGLDENPEKVRAKITRLVQYIVVVMAAMAIISNFGMNFEVPLGKENTLTPVKFLAVVLIFLLAQVVSWVLTQIILYSIFKQKEFDEGTRFAINQLLKYVIYTIATLIAIANIWDMTLLLGGAAALLVGVGLGLQQTFNDFFSGLVLLFERSVSVGDIMEVGSNVGVVKKIGLRSSIIETRGNVSIIVPNSKLVNDSVKNWSHFVDHGRFQVDVGVAYGSDTALVKKILLEVCNEHKLIREYPPPFVRFNDFADSSLNFSIMFFSNQFLIVEDIKSDLRFKIDAQFREHNIQIPFPQRDVWMRKEE